MSYLSSFRKVMIIISLSVFFASCSDIESDAKKAAELQCKANKLVEKISKGDATAAEESRKLGIEISSFMEEMKEKYTDDNDKRAFGEAMQTELLKCK